MKIVIEIDTGLTGTDHALRALRAMSDQSTQVRASVILDSGQHTFVVTEIVGVVGRAESTGYILNPLEEA